MRYVLIALALLACGPGSGPTQPIGESVHALLATPACVDPVAHGAVSDDGQDDRAAIQAAIDAACARPVGERHVCLPPGTLHAVRNPRIGATNLASIQIRCDDLEISGEGAYASAISMLGSGVDPRDTRGPNDWWLLDARGAARFHLHDLALLGDERRDTNEQAHLLQLKGPLVAPLVERVRTYLPTHRPPEGAIPCPLTMGYVGGAWCTPEFDLLGWFGGGDCIRLLGEHPDDTVDGSDQRIYDATIREWEAPECDRSALGLQRGHVRTRVEDAQLVTYDDQVIDSEPTGHRGYDDLQVIGVHLSRGQDLGGLTLSISGSSEGVSSVREYDCRGGAIPHGATRLFDVSDVTFRDCHFDSGVESTEPTVGVMKRARRVRFIGGSMRRPAGAPPAAVLHVEHQSGASATSVILDGVTIIQETPRSPVIARSLRSLVLRNVTIRYTATGWNGPAVMAEPIIVPDHSLSLAGVRVEAPLGAFTVLVSAGRRGGVSLLDVTVAPGALRSAVVAFAGGVGAALHATNVSAPGVPGIAGGNGPPLCRAGCP